MAEYYFNGIPESEAFKSVKKRAQNEQILKLERRIEELEANLKIKNALIDRAISACSMYRDQPIFELLEHDMRKAREES